MAVVERPARVRPWLRRLAIAAFVILVPTALFAAWDYIEARRLAHLVDAIKARHEPVDMNKRAGVSMGEPRNAARFYDAAAALLIDTRAASSRSGFLDELDSPDPRDRTRGYARLRTWLESNADAESLIARGTALEFLGYPAGTDYNFRWDRLFWLAALTSLRSRERIDAGDGDGALRSVTQQLKLCRALQDSVVSGRIGYGLLARSAANAQAAIALHSSDEALHETQLAFQEHDVDSGLERAVLRSRARMLDRFWDATHSWYARAPGFNAPPGGLVFASPFIVRPFVAHRVIESTRELSAWLEIARRPWPDRLHVPKVRRPVSTTSKWSYANQVAKSEVVMLEEEFQLIGLALATVRSASAALAIERYRLAHDGRPPASLTDLVPLFLPAVPTDPYSGRPLIYRLLPERYVVYSIGPDEKDDRGTPIAWPKRHGWIVLEAAAGRDIGIEGKAEGRTWKVEGRR